MHERIEFVLPFLQFELQKNEIQKHSQKNVGQDHSRPIQLKKIKLFCLFESTTSLVFVWRKLSPSKAISREIAIYSLENFVISFPYKICHGIYFVTLFPSKYQKTHSYNGKK
jgi:hypothetical protein